MFGWIFNYKKRQARRLKKIHKRQEKILRLWSKRDNYQFGTKKWQKFDAKINKLIDKTSQLMIKHESFQPDWFIILRNKFLLEQQ